MTCANIFNGGDFFFDWVSFPEKEHRVICVDNKNDRLTAIGIPVI